MQLPPDLAEKAVAHLPACAYIAFTFWLWGVIVFLAIAGTILIVVGSCFAIRDKFRIYRTWRRAWRVDQKRSVLQHSERR